MRRFCLQNVESILEDTKKDLPKWTGPFTYYISVIFTPLRLPRRLEEYDYQHITANLGNIWKTL